MSSSKLYSLRGQIQNARSKMYRKLYIKRRVLGSGLYEDDWQDISDDVIKWGNIRKEVDSNKVNSFKFDNVTLTMSNRYGRYNPYDDENSMWFGYSDQQRTLVKIVIGFVYEVKIDGIWQRFEFPEYGAWDRSGWDSGLWDQEEPAVFNGIITGDIYLTGDDQIKIPCAPMTSVFRLFAAKRLTGWNSSLTAETFVQMLRDQVDSAGNYIFRPFFNNTTSGWVINPTTKVYPNLNTSTADDVFDATVWEVIEKLAEAENFVPHVTNDGSFNFVARTYNNTSSIYSFYGEGGTNSEFGQTVKKVSYLGRRYSKFYSRVSVQFKEDDTTTSFSIQEATFRVSGDSTPWTLGERTLDVQNLWLQTVTDADILANDLFEEYSAVRTEIEFTTSLVPHLDLLNRVDVTYDPSPVSPQSLWDLYNWGDNTNTTLPDDLLWDNSIGDALKLNNREFRLISIDINLDTGETKFIGRD
jgi:hypothetical protein